ncbi:MAG: hypothetical protein VB128_00830 [Sedimentibacter saalensis]|uniref:hypothetical protein n=1 Tax=Sedimentibacter saalensis TaxID=130788 RepID=UPI002B1FC189|nr:hypothetical protein [Sedimentibacter saalensis]MEA5093476.1 hypothetical protein [Sedimentibacter saalensis]
MTNRYNVENIYYKMCIGFLIGFMLLIYSGALLWQPVPMGESDDYMLATVSLQYRGDLAIRQSDLEQAIVDFPEFADYLKANYDAGLMSEYVDENEGRLPWYFGTYSALCIPVKIILGSLGLPQIYTYAITNCMLYLLALLCILLFLNRSMKERFYLIILIAINPAVFYIVWQSAEVCIFSLMVLSLIFFANKNFKLAALFVSIAGTLNSTVMIYGMVIILAYFVELLKEIPINKWIMEIKKNLKEIFELALYFIPCLIPFIYYYINFNVFNLQVAYGFADNSNYFGRFFAYLFDWNFGILPYYLIILILFIVLSVFTIIKKQFKGLFYTLSFFGVIAAFSIMWHINCGMSGIARYNVWVAPIMIFGTIKMISEIKSYKIRKLTDILIGLSAVLSTLIIFQYGVMFAYKTSDIRLTPIAEKILNTYPSLYYSYPSTFVSRVMHIPGGYDYTDLVIYENDQNMIKKIMVSANSWEKLVDEIEGDEEGINYIKNYEHKIMKDPHFIFINVPFQYHLSIKPEYKLRQINKLSDGVLDYSELSTSGEINSQDGEIVIGNGQIQFGPYIDLQKGKYEVTVKGKNLMNAEYAATGKVGTESYAIEMIQFTDETITYQFTLEKATENAEFISKNISNNDVIIDRVYLKIIER